MAHVWLALRIILDYEKKIYAQWQWVPVFFLLMKETKAQVRVGRNSNMAMQPSQGYYPANYYYFPEIDTYYDIPNRRFIYFE